jgi:hypothetical protein
MWRCGLGNGSLEPGAESSSLPWEDSQRAHFCHRSSGIRLPSVRSGNSAPGTYVGWRRIRLVRRGGLGLSLGVGHAAPFVLRD